MTAMNETKIDDDANHNTLESTTATAATIAFKQNDNIDGMDHDDHSSMMHAGITPTLAENSLEVSILPSSSAGNMNEANKKHSTKNKRPSNDSVNPARRKSSQLDSSDRSTMSQSVAMVAEHQRDAAAASLGFFSTKQNSAYKWQRAKGVVGALEVASEPMLRIHEKLQLQTVSGEEENFQHAIDVWERLDLRKDFVRAIEKIPTETCCCGFMDDEDESKRRFVTMLNVDWCKRANKKLLSKGFKVDVFLWNWQNASGKAETNIILIRFFELSSNRFRRASNDGSKDFELLDVPDKVIEEPEAAKMLRT